MSQPRRKATYDDLLKVPDYKVAEIIDGELIVNPRPASLHALAGAGYAREGVAHLWFVDPLKRRLEVYRLGDGAFQLRATHEGSDEIRAEPFDAVDLARWWGEA